MFPVLTCKLPSQRDMHQVIVPLPFSFGWYHGYGDVNWYDNQCDSF